MARTRVFDCLNRDPDYPGIRGWWWDQFGVSFKESWDANEATEQDFADSFERQIMIQGRKMFVTLSPDGYHVDEETQCL